MKIASIPKKQTKNSVSSPVVYVLRRMLPLWKAEEEIADTVRFCIANGFQEVMWLLEPPDRFGFVFDPKELAEYLPALKLAHKELTRVGIACSIDQAHTLGHGDMQNHYVTRYFPKSATMVGFDGQHCRESICPLAPEWRQWVEDYFPMLASVQPSRIWINDDFRLVNHRPIMFACYCDEHIRTFRQRIGRAGKLTRAELVKAILRPGTPHPLREQWLDFLGETLAQAAGRIRKAVHKVSPRTHVCLMGITSFLNEVEGRDCAAVLRSFAVPHPPTLRANTSGYQERSLRDFYVGDESLKRIAPFCPAGSHIYTEIESMPYYLYAKSIAWIEAQVAWSAAIDVSRHTFNIYDRMGSSYREQAPYGAMLKRLRPYLEGLAVGNAGAGRQRGVRLLNSSRSARYTHATDGKLPIELAAHDSGWADALRAFGMPITFMGDEPVAAITGQALRAHEDKIPELFARGVLLDLSALETLVSMGYGDLAGVRIKETLPWGQTDNHVGHEALIDPEFGGGQHVRTYCCVTDRFGVLEPGTGARIVSEIQTMGGRPLFPGVVIFGNKLGGRIAVYPYNLVNPKNLDMYEKKTNSYFYSLPRRNQMRAVLDWVAGNKLPLLADAEGWILPHRTDGPRSLMFAAMNLNLDPWNKVTFTASEARVVKQVTTLSPRGKWTLLPANNWRQTMGRLTITVRHNIAPLKILAVRAVFKR